MQWNVLRKNPFSKFHSYDPYMWFSIACHTRYQSEPKQEVNLVFHWIHNCVIWKFYIIYLLQYLGFLISQSYSYQPILYIKCKWFINMHLQTNVSQWGVEDAWLIDHRKYQFEWIQTIALFSLTIGTRMIPFQCWLVASRNWQTQRRIHFWSKASMISASCFPQERTVHNFGWDPLPSSIMVSLEISLINCCWIEGVQRCLMQHSESTKVISSFPFSSRYIDLYRMTENNPKHSFIYNKKTKNCFRSENVYISLFMYIK